MKRSRKAPTLPCIGANPWAGNDTSRWKEEAVIANAACEVLNTYWATDNVAEVIASVPTGIIPSNYHPYSDGQSNSKITFNSWTEKFPPVVAALVQYTDDTSAIFVRVHSKVPILNKNFDAEFTNFNNEQVTRTFTGTEQSGPSGTYLGFSWNIASTDKISLTALTNFVFMLRPSGWDDSFPISFLMPSQPLEKFYASIPFGLRKFKDGGDIVDHEKVSSQNNPADPTKTPFERLMSTPRSPAYFPQPFEPDNIHARFPDQHGVPNIVTGVGMGWTWVAGGLQNADPSLAPWKTMYTFFQARQPDQEAIYGVTSGCGWHQVEDPAETFSQDLETIPILTGYGVKNMPPPSEIRLGTYAYGLDTITSYRLLWPGETFSVRQGVTYADRFGTKWDQHSFQWYAFHTDKNVGMEEWVHPAIPDNSYGFAPNPFVYTPLRVWP